MLTPTRELAIQVAKDFKDVSKRVSIACFYGGSSYMPQSKCCTKNANTIQMYLIAAIMKAFKKWNMSIYFPCVFDI